MTTNRPADRPPTGAGKSATTPVTTPDRARRPKHPGAALSDAIILGVGVVLVTVGIWVRHGGRAALTGGTGSRPGSRSPR